MRIIAFAAIVFSPTIASAGCSTDELRACILTPHTLSASTQSRAYDGICTYMICATAASASMHFRFGDGSTARIDYTDDGAGLFQANLGFLLDPNVVSVYSDLPVEISGSEGEPITVMTGDHEFLRVEPCTDERCAGVDVEAFGN